MSTEERKVFSILVIDRPPVKGHFDAENERRKLKLQEEARRRLGDFKPKSHRFNIKINYYWGEGAEDLTNAEGGIHDALNKIVYDDDRDVWSASIERHLVVKDPTWYRVDIEFLEPGMSSEDGELEKQQKSLSQSDTTLKE